MNRIKMAVAGVAMLGLGACVGYGYPGSGYPSGDYGYPDSGYGYPDYGNQGNGYGNNNYGSNGSIRCESSDNRTRRCNVDTRGGVRLTRQLSDTRCVQGRNWGYDRSGIWVSQGCRAEFVVGSGGYDSGYGSNQGYGQTLRCESDNNRQRRCNVSVNRGVTLIRQLSDTRCVQGQNWGWDRGGIWVTGGCRGEFRVR